jgi:hypothetical protein
LVTVCVGFGECCVSILPEKILVNRRTL